MKKLAVFATALAVVLASVSMLSAATYAHSFEGSQKCKICHMSPKKGNQFKVWQDSKHAQAFATLQTEEANKLSGEKPAAENPKCLKCHVTGFDAPADKKGAKYDQADGVSCEGCHGPGSDYSPMKVMKDKAVAIQNGLVIPDEKTCKTCHNEESPTYKAFDFKTFWPKVAHDNPLTE